MRDEKVAKVQRSKLAGNHPLPLPSSPLTLFHSCFSRSCVLHLQLTIHSDVMMWALLMGHSDLAKVAWTHTTLPTHTALIASHFCKLLATRFANEGTVCLHTSISLNIYSPLPPLIVISDLNFTGIHWLSSRVWDQSNSSIGKNELQRGKRGNLSLLVSVE